MLFLIFGIMDFFFAVMMLLAHLDVFASWRIALAAFVFWVAKGMIYRGSFLSVLDVLAGIYFIVVMIGARTAIVYLFLIIMAYKMLLSLMYRG